MGAGCCKGSEPAPSSVPEVKAVPGPSGQAQSPPVQQPPKPEPIHVADADIEQDATGVSEESPESPGSPGSPATAGSVPSPALSDPHDDAQSPRTVDSNQVPFILRLNMLTPA